MTKPIPGSDEYVQWWLDTMPIGEETFIQNLGADDRTRPGRAILGEMHLVRSSVRDGIRTHVYRVNFLELSTSDGRPTVYLYMRGNEVIEYAHAFAPYEMGDGPGMLGHPDVHLTWTQRFFNQALQRFGDELANAERISVEYRDSRPVMIDRQSADSWNAGR